MPINITRGQTDEVIDRMVQVLRAYEVDHPNAQIDLYRQNPVSVRLRIIDPDFAGQSKPQRNRTAWRYLEQLSDEEQSDISTLLLLTPDELGVSFANLEFNDPTPSNL